MKWNEQIKWQLTAYVKNPAVLMSITEEPYEYRAANGSISRLKRRRLPDIEISYQLYTFLLENGISKNQLREFGSGLFLNWIETNKIYV